MNARDVMTTPTVCVSPDMSTRDVAKLLLEKGVSGVPVVDAAGAPLGFISEGDLIAPPDREREATRERWLVRLAEGEMLAGDFLAHIANAAPQTAGAAMSAPAVCVQDSASVAEIARLMADRHVKRLPVVRDGVIVGIVSRVDILRAVSSDVPTRPAPTPQPPLVVDRAAVAAPPPSASVDGALDAALFRQLNDAFAMEQERQRRAARQAALEARKHLVEELEHHHLKEQEWAEMIAHAREAAAHGLKEYLLLRFPSELCSDGGRAINAPEAGWPNTLRGEAEELYARWERDLKPLGFGLTAQILNFPGGRPGDVGLSLVWGK